MNGYRSTFKVVPVVLFMLLGLSSMALADTVTVTIVNSQAVPIYVSFTTLTQAAGVITWNSAGNGCVNTGKGANAAYTQINAGQTCTASVDTSNSSSRFCAALNAAPANCMTAQTQHLTMVETNFEAASNAGCFNSGAACVWYDISVIPSTCTDTLWKQNQCANTGGASYNLPVTLACSGNSAEPVYTCQGPTNGSYRSGKLPQQVWKPERDLCHRHTELHEWSQHLFLSHV